MAAEPSNSVKSQSFGKLHDILFEEVVYGKCEDSNLIGVKSLHSRLKDLTNVDKSIESPPLNELKGILTNHGINVDDLNEPENNKFTKKTDNDEYAIEGNDALSIRTPLKRFTTVMELADESKEDSVSRSLVCCVQGLPDYIIGHNSMIENLISFIIFHLIKEIKVSSEVNNSDIELDLDYKWSIIMNESFVHSKHVFVKFNDILTLYLFQKLLDGAVQTREKHSNDDNGAMNVIVNTSVKQKVIPEIINRFKFEINNNKDKAITTLKPKVENRIEKMRQELADEDTEMTSEDVDEYTKMYNNYKIDSKDLSHIPADMLETVKKSVIDFRLHALKVEKEKKEKRLLNEKIKAVNKLGSLLNVVDEDGDDTMDGQQSFIGVDGDDWEREVKKLKSEQAKEEESLNTDLQEYKKREEHRLKAHEKYLKMIKHEVYINEYIPNARKQFLAKFVNPVKDTNNSMDKNFQYYTVHGNYVKFRQKKKLDEQAKDDEDRNLENIDDNTTTKK